MSSAADVRPAETAPRVPPAEERVVPLELVRALCAALAAEGVVYCHWKSNEALDRSMTGDNDLDLLVARPDQNRFVEVLSRLGFKAATLPAAREVPAVVHYYGLDEPSGRLVHVHAHFRLVLGDDTTKNFWLPVERAYLASSRLEGIFPVPAPEYELAVLVLRLVLKHSSWDALLQARGALAASEARELAWLRSRTDWSRVEDVIARELPFLLAVWPDCRRAVEPGCPVAARVRAAARLSGALRSCARRPRLQDTTLRLTRRTSWGARRYLVRRPVRKRLAHGGGFVAIVGGDGAGKSTAVDGVVGWLSGSFVVRRVHLGRPPRSVGTLAVKSALGAGRRLGLFPDLAEPTAPPTDPSRVPSTAWLVWHVLTARDRHRLYVRARRVAANGGIVVSDRYPLEQLRLMDGPRTQWARDLPGLGRAGAALVDLEARYYSAFARPDLLAVLRVHPEVAVARKTDEEQSYVRRRSTEVWTAAWGADAVLVDASQPAADVLAALRTAVWERL